MNRNQIIFLAAVCLTSLAFAEDRFVSKEGGYSIQFPTGWTSKPNGQEVTGVDPDQTVNVHIQVERLPASMNVDRYIEANLTDMKKKLNEFQKKDGGNISVPAINSQARWVFVSFKTDKGTVSVVYYYVFSLKDRKIFILSGAGKPEDFDKRKNDFDTIARSMAQQ